MSTLFVIKLLENKYYIGSNHNIQQIFKYIFSNKEKKEKWLMKYKPLYIDKIIYNCSEHDEYHLLLKYMKEYGYENVWGHTCDSFLIEDIIKKNI